jgi:hypothetical protein
MNRASPVDAWSSLSLAGKQGVVEAAAGKLHGLPDTNAPERACGKARAIGSLLRASFSMGHENYGTGASPAGGGPIALQAIVRMK